LLIFKLDNANAGDRKILTERFTSSTCIPCANVNPTFEAFLNAQDPEKIANISYHMNWPAPGNDPMYLINPSDNTARRTLYGVNSIPNWFFDGVMNVGTSTAALQNAYNQRINILSPVTLIVSEIINGNDVTVKAEVYCEGLLSNPNVAIQFAVIEKIVYYNAPNGETSFHHVMRRFLPNASGTVVTLLPGNRVNLEYSYVMDPAWNPAQISNLVFAQESPIEILNCAHPTTNFNLVSAPGFRVITQGQNGNGNYNVRIPSVAAGFNSPVSFTYEVVPPNAGITAVFTGGNTISNFPDSLNVTVSSTAAVPVGEYKIVFTGTSGTGKTHKTFVNYLVGKNYITVGNNRPSLTYRVNGTAYSSSRAFSWDLNSNQTLEAVSPQTFGNTRYMYDSWSNGGAQTQTISVGTTLSSYTAFYKTQYRLLGTLSPSGLPVTISNSGNYLDSGSVNNITVSEQQVQHNGRTYYFNRWEGIGSGSYSGTNAIANITMNEFIVQRAIYDTIDVGISNYNSVIPDKFALYQNYPNPFNPTTNIKFDISKSTHTSLVIYDMLGKEVINLVNENLAPGSYQYTFNASALPSGIFYYKIKTDAFTEIRKMILLK
jgi:hypothetical protein